MFVPKFQLSGHEAAVTCVRFSPDEKYVASCSDDHEAKIWDADTGQFIRQYSGHTMGISELSWSSDSRFLATASDDQTIRIWQVGTGDCIAVLGNGHNYHVSTVDFNYKTNLLVSGGVDEDVIIWSTVKKSVEKTLQAHTDPISSVRFSPDGTVIASAGHDGLIRIWDSTSAHCLFTFITPDKSPIMYMEFSPNGKYLLACSTDGKTRLWSCLGNKCAKTFELPVKDEEEEGKYAAAARIWRGSHVIQSHGKQISIWDIQTKQLVSNLDSKHTSQVLSLDVLQNKLVSCSVDKSIIIWSSEKKEKRIN